MRRIAAWLERFWESDKRMPVSDHVSNDDAANAIAAVRAAHLTYCGKPKLENLAAAALRVVREEVPGDFIEAGVALGGSAIVLARLKGARRLDLYDVFGMIPPPSDRDGEDAHRRYAEIASGQSRGIADDMYYGYVSDLKSHVEQNLAQFGIDLARNQVFLLPGLFEATLRPERPIALAHIDCDWYDSVKICIERVTHLLSVGGMMAFDDYSSYSGCRRAVDEWLAENSQMEIVCQDRSLVVRKSQ